MKKTDKDWDRWGASAPYYGVLSINKFRPEHLDAEALNGFFASGEAHVHAVFSRIEFLTKKEFKPRIALDFGCGVGRLAIPMAKRSEATIAVDVSPAMRAETKRNCEAHGIRNVEVVASDDDLSLIPANIDFVHSFIVLQHIPPSRGEGIISGLAKRVSDNGFLALQFYTRCNSHWLIRGLVRTRYLFPPANWIRNLIKSRPFREQAMELHVYDLPNVLRILRQAGFPEIDIHLDTEAEGQFESVFLLAQRTHFPPSIVNPLA